MKIKHFILLTIFMLFAVSCGSGLSFGNPNDKNSDAYQGNDADAEKTDGERPDGDRNDSDPTDSDDDAENPSGRNQGELYGECYPNKTCNEGLECDEENNICIKDTGDSGHTTPDGDSGDSGDTDHPDSGADSGHSGDTGEEPDEDGTPTDLPGCNEGDSQKCEYEGPANTEDVGTCKAATRTCKADGTWGPCSGAVLPVIESGELCSDGLDNDCDGLADNGGYCGDTGDSGPDSDSDSGYHGSGNTGGYSDQYEIPQDEGNPEGCVDTCVPIQAECLSEMASEAAAGLCDGLDNDCDGQVDEGCPCTAGQTQPCFMGPPNYRNVGACVDGVQTCVVNLKDPKAVLGRWGECVGGMMPKIDVCDNSDNNCNGCIDDQLCCQPPIDCAYDIGTAIPFVDKTINGNEIYDTGHRFNDADTATWEWTLTKGPCDIVLNKISFKVKGAKTFEELEGEGDNSNSVSGVGLSHFKVLFQLSGSYLLHLKVTRQNGEVYECSWIIRVVSEGLRIELCWDTTGSVDLDLHLAKEGTTTSWTGSNSSGACYYANCKSGVNTSLNWGYATTQNYDTNGNWKNMYNPRLDIDNIRTVGIPENINLDNPNDGDTFRIGVRYYQGSLQTHPVVNVYCGGTLKATFGVEPQVDNFKNEDAKTLWKVAEVKWIGNYTSDACEITPKFSDSGYILGSVDTYDW